MNCPQCNSSDIRHSHRSVWTDLFHSKLGRGAFRCRSCKVRFHAPEKTKPVPRDFSRRMERYRRLALQALIFTAMLVMFLLFLRYLIREPGMASETGRLSVRQIQDAV